MGGGGPFGGEAEEVLRVLPEIRLVAVCRNLHLSVDLCSFLGFQAFEGIF